MSSSTKAKLPAEREVIVVDSDSDEDAYSSKRARANTGHATSTVKQAPANTATMSGANLATKNAHLKGRQRFKADVEDARIACQQGLHMHSMQICKLREGGDEGQIEFQVHSRGNCLVKASFLVSESSEYPSNHTFYAFSPGDTPHSKYAEIIGDVPSYPSLPLMSAVERMVSKLAGLQAPSSSQQQVLLPRANEDEEEANEDSENDDYFDYDEFDASQNIGSSVKGNDLQRDFIEMVASGYRPGLIKVGGNEFLLTASVSVISLANSIPPRALVTWDHHLLSSSQHLTLLISGFNGVYPSLNADGKKTPLAESKTTNLKFSVGLCPQYKPGNEQAREACRNFGLVEDRLERATTVPNIHGHQDMHNYANISMDAMREKGPEPKDPGRFDKFALSSSLESLMNRSFLKLVYLRRNVRLEPKTLGWAAAETLLALTEKTQSSPQDVLENEIMLQQVLDADRREEKLARSNPLPHDPLRDSQAGSHINMPLTAFCYLIRRLTLCTRYCTVCHNPIDLEYEVLRPYVCSSNLCAYQYYVMGWGPSLEYEILHNTSVVDLLLSLTYTAARENQLSDPLPIGLGLQVPPPDSARMAQIQKLQAAPRLALVPGYAAPPAPPVNHKAGIVDEHRLCEFDKLDIWQMRVVIGDLISLLPSVNNMKRHLTTKTQLGKIKPALYDMDPTIPKAAWLLLRWCIASCTADLEELVQEEDLVQNVDPVIRQFRFSVGAPDAEAKFKAAVEEGKKTDANCNTYPILYAFHGSPLKNWHSIIRHGLWYKEVAHGRAYGNGVYFAKDGNVSMSRYARSSSEIWKNSNLRPTSCMALTEIVNLPNKFVSQTPYYVVQHTEWLLCRYLLVMRTGSNGQSMTGMTGGPDPAGNRVSATIPLVRLDPRATLQIGLNKIAIPEPGYKLEKLVKARASEFKEDDNDKDDKDVLEGIAWAASQPPSRMGTRDRPIELIEDDDIEMVGVNWASGPGAGQASTSRALV
ncbi:hypothetical protein BOTBODRAFT_152662 [Botryobasidium botryosum FD-172 SS1]|uniref:PARP catalytic domain-containing protein n=1 Tax=Botryobasidium botryosum (strain FD-172 SS1) TaxID=930990 RepID=A0A067N7E3_BOTB1|nr:hypothetical protein BOTBODRAFT_152662 [Botryobasidium botryosum FD-172 SS1]